MRMAMSMSTACVLLALSVASATAHVIRRDVSKVSDCVGRQGLELNGIA